MKIKDLKRNLLLAHGYFLPQKKLPRNPTIMHIDFSFNIHRLDFTTDEVVIFTINDCKDGKWKTYLQERNNKFEIKIFHSEQEACHDFYVSMVNHWGGLEFDWTPQNITSINRLYKYLATYMAYHQIEPNVSYKRRLHHSYIEYKHNNSRYRIIKKGNVWRICSKTTTLLSTTDVQDFCRYFLQTIRSVHNDNRCA